MEQLGNQPSGSFDDVLEDVRILNEQGPGHTLPEAVLTDEDWIAYYAEVERLRKAHRIDPNDCNIRLR